jgi:hypothetical protein
VQIGYIPLVSIANHHGAPVVVRITLSNPAYAVGVVPIVPSVTVRKQLTCTNKIGELGHRWLRVLATAAIQVTPEYTSGLL